MLGIKHYAGGKDAFETELMTLTLLHGTLPVPEVVNVDEDRLVIVYRWIDGITLHELRKAEPGAFASLAEPLGRVLACIARTDATEPFELTPILERAYRQLVDGRARNGSARRSPTRSGTRSKPPSPRWRSARSACPRRPRPPQHPRRAGDAGSWRIAGVIDWEATSTGSPLLDIGSLFRYGRATTPRSARRSSAAIATPAASCPRAGCSPRGCSTRPGWSTCSTNPARSPGSTPTADVAGPVRRTRAADEEPRRRPAPRPPGRRRPAW